MRVVLQVLYTGSMMSVVNISKTGKRRYNVKLWKAFMVLFDYLPVSALIDEKILYMHGGLSRIKTSRTDKELSRPKDVPDQGKI
jgi:serine/threonine-protein phosphatase PP1 catalytic subunit